MRRLGIHTSIAGGLHLSLVRADELGCTTMQIFSHNPRQWNVLVPPGEEALEFQRFRKLYDIGPVYIHCSYLINLCASDSAIYKKSVELLVKELDIADSLGAEYVVLHPGSASLEPAESGRKKIMKALAEIAGEGSWRSRLLLENTAGEKGDVSSRIEDLAEILEVDPGRGLIAGICLDSCHAFQAGYEISTLHGLAEITALIERTIGVESVKLIHLNDSKRKFDSRVDRHEHIGLGSIGLAGLKTFMNGAAFGEVPLILETPRDIDGADRKNLQTVRNILYGENGPA